GDNEDVGRKVIIISSCLLEDIDSTKNIALMDATDKCISVDFVLLVKVSSGCGALLESMGKFNRNICDLENCSFHNHLSEASQHSESGTPNRRRDLKKRLRSRHVCSMSGSLEPRRGHFESPRKRYLERKMVFKRLDKGVFHRLGDKGKSISAYSNDSRRQSYRSSRRDTESLLPEFSLKRNRICF
ncbi:hypothetical protein Tco_1399664, partial [Tanacetum coccineum]